jgi:energy-coupling factor transporter ATP-binding protein EcfA2
MGTAARAGMQRPVFVAVGGDSGSGKSTLTAGFTGSFPPARSPACAWTITTAWTGGNAT